MPPERKAHILRLWAAVLQGQKSIQDYLDAVSDIDARR